MFNIIPKDSSNFVSAHLAEGPGSFIQATIAYRELFAGEKKSKNDKYYGVTLHSEQDEKHVPKLDKSFIDYYKKEKPQRFFQHKTYSKKMAGGSKVKDNGDLTNPKTIKLFGGNFSKKKADLITADGGFNWKNENLQEQEAFRLILAQVITALKIQDQNGSFICKIFETYTMNTLKLINILTLFYKEVYITKPLTSRKSNSEKYIVCIGFSNNKKNNKVIEYLERILTEMYKNQDKFLMSYFNDYNPSNYLIGKIKDLNNNISNNQFESINTIINFIKNSNVYGDKFNLFRDKQITATKYWLDNFLPKENLEKKKRNRGKNKK